MSSVGAAGDLGIDQAHGLTDQVRDLVTTKELVTVELSVWERLCYAKRSNALRGGGGPVVGRHVGEAERLAWEASHRVSATRCQVDACQQSVDERNRLVARHGRFSQERPVGEASVNALAIQFLHCATAPIRARLGEAHR